jgi:hypothetical protein
MLAHPDANSIEFDNPGSSAVVPNCSASSIAQSEPSRAISGGTLGVKLEQSTPGAHLIFQDEKRMQLRRVLNESAIGLPIVLKNVLVVMRRMLNFTPNTGAELLELLALPSLVGSEQRAPLTGVESNVQRNRVALISWRFSTT